MESDKENVAAIVAFLLLKIIGKREKERCGQNLPWGGEVQELRR